MEVTCENQHFLYKHSHFSFLLLVSFLVFPSFLLLQISSYVVHNAFPFRIDHQPWVLWLCIRSISACASRYYYAQVEIQQRHYHFLQRGKSNEIISRLPFVTDNSHESLEYVKRLQESSHMLVTSICHPVRSQTWPDTTIILSILSFGSSSREKTQPMLRSRYGSMVAQVHLP